MARFQLFLAALWWGSLTMVGFVVVPLLFVHLATPAMAGQMAAKLFSAQMAVSIVCGLLLLVSAQRQHKDAVHTPSVWVIAGILLALLIEVGVKPRILARENLALWHNLGTAFYLAQWLCATRFLWGLMPSAGQPRVSA